MICPHCGSQVSDEAKVCPSCGATLSLNGSQVAPLQYIAPQYVASQYVLPPPSYGTGYGAPPVGVPSAVSAPVAVPAVPPVVPPPVMPGYGYGAYPPLLPPYGAYYRTHPMPPKPVEKIMENPSYFDGGAFEMFFMNLAAFLVSLITLTLLSPAMTCWKERWRCEHTYLHGRRLSFDGKGIQLFGKRMLWLLLSIVTLGIYALFFRPIAEQKWLIRHTHFADRGNLTESESYFDGGILGRLGVNLFTGFVMLITLFIGSFWATCYKERWYKSHTIIDQCRLFFDGKGIQLFGKRVAWFFLTLITLGIFGFWLGVKLEKWYAKHTHTRDTEKLPPLKK